MKTRSLFTLLLAVLLVTAFAVCAVNATEEISDPEYITTTQPVSGIWGDISAVVRINSADELTAVAAKEKMPAIAIFDVDADLYVLDDSGTAFSTVYGVIKALNFNVIPAYYVENEEEATAVAAYLAEEFTDAFIISDDLAALKAAKDACPLLGRVADYTSLTSLSSSDYAELRTDLYNNYATVIMLDGALCTKDVVSSFKGKRLLVWASLSDTPTKTEVFGAVNSGAVAVVSDDSDAVIDTACALSENTMTRAPQIQAHRGYTSNGYYFENTKESIINAYLKGAKAIEFDIHLSAVDDDGTRKLVLYHDGVTKAADTVDGEQYDISDTPWSVLYEKVLYTSELGYEYRLSHLEEVFEYFYDEKEENGGVLDLLMTIEIKPGSSVDIVDYLFELLEKYDLFEQARITTFTMSYINRAKELNPALPTNYLQNASVIFDSTAEANINDVRALIGSTSSSYSPSAYYGGKVDIGPVTMRTLIRRGYMASYWGMGDTPQNNLYYGILGFGTDYLETTDPIVMSVSPTGLNEELKVPSGRTVEIGAVVNKRVETNVPVGDFEIVIIEGKDLVKDINGGKITFAEGTGTVSFAIKYLYSAGKLEYTLYSDPVTLTVTKDAVFEGGVSMDGYSVRFKEYSGLRGIFSFDKGYSEKIEDELGYTLIEYGAIVVSETAYEAAECKVTLDPETLELTTGGYKAAIWSNGEYKNRILGTEDGVDTYCLAIVNYTDGTHSKNAYFVGYSVYESPEGEIIITYDDYDIPEERMVNLYQLTLDMYINGAINASNTDEAAVWNTLLTGAVTLTESDYNPDKLYKMDGETRYSGDFLFSEIPVIMRGTVSTTIDVTLVENPRDSSWVAIYRGEGDILSNYDNNVNVQISSDYKATTSPNPHLTTASEGKINTIIYDHGIKKLGTYILYKHDGVETVVFSSSMESFTNATFQYAHNLDTAYMAKATGSMQKNAKGILDFSEVSIPDTGTLVRQCRGGIGIHLPGDITSIGGSFHRDSSTSSTFVKIWCGDSAEPEEGIIDLTGAKSLTSIGNYSLQYMPKVTVLKLPDSCTSIGTGAFHHDGSTSKITTPIATICQATKNDTILEYCKTNNITYTNLDGTVTYYTATAE